MRDGVPGASVAAGPARRRDDRRLRRARDPWPAGLHRVRLLRRDLPVPHLLTERFRGAKRAVAARERVSVNAGARVAMRFDQRTAPHARPLVSVPVVMRRVLYALAAGSALPHVVLRLWLADQLRIDGAAALLTEARCCDCAVGARGTRCATAARS